MSVLLWWVPALMVVAVTWWRLRFSERSRGAKDMRALRRALQADR
ncbi:MAG: hypothetical protein R2720_06780 [Candidatus Nanopelagicales bacterium]